LGYHHARLLRDLSGSAFAGIYDRNTTRAETVARELGVRAWPSLDALVEVTDAVSIVVPTAHHAATAATVLGSGRHAFIEKPVTTTVADADLLAGVAAATGAVVQVGHVERYNRAVRAARPVVERPWYVEGERLAPYTPRGADVSVVLDLMIHDVDLVRWFLGSSPVRVDAIGAAWMRPTADLAQARLTFADGAVANLTAMRMAGERRRTLRLFQSNGLVRCDLAAGTAEFWRVRDDVDPAVLATMPQQPEAFAERIPLDAPEGETLRLELQEWLTAITTRQPPPVTMADGREALRIALEIEAAIAAGVAQRAAAGSLAPRDG
jgi:predicted dehydrogenase